MFNIKQLNMILNIVADIVIDTKTDVATFYSTLLFFCFAMFCYVVFVLLCSAMLFLFCYVELKLFHFHHLNTYYVWWCWYWYVDISLYQRWWVIVRSCSTEVDSFKVLPFITNQMKPANKQTIRFLLCWWIAIVIL